MCTLRGKTPQGSSNVRGALRHYVPNKGLYPLHRKSGYPLMAKGVTSKSHAFYLFYCLTNPPRTRGALYAC